MKIYNIFGVEKYVKQCVNGEEKRPKWIHNTAVETLILLLYKTLSQKPAKMSDSPPHCRKTKLLFVYAKKEKKKNAHTHYPFLNIYIYSPNLSTGGAWVVVVGGCIRTPPYLIYPSACRTHYWPISSLYTVVGTYIYIYNLPNEKDSWTQSYCSFSRAGFHAYH